MNVFFTVKEFADILRIHPRTVLRMIKKGRIHPINVGSIERPQYSIPEEDLLRLRAESFVGDYE
jgi:excisionase family DNA binding protein